MSDSIACVSSTAGDVSAPQHGRAYFETTRWSIVLAAARPDTPGAFAALEELCRGYWYPLYAYARRQGKEPRDAEDSTQEFFARLLEKNYLASVNPSEGRFRSFLIATFRHFLSNEWNRARMLKRGGGYQIVSFDEESPETRYKMEPPDRNTPEVAFDRHWAIAILNRVVTSLEQEYTANGKADLFVELKGFLSEKTATPHAEIASRLGVGIGTVGTMVHRLRRRYAELLRKEVAQTLRNPAEVEDEIRHLIAALSG